MTKMMSLSLSFSSSFLITETPLETVPACERTVFVPPRPLKSSVVTASLDECLAGEGEKGANLTVTERK